MAGPNIAHHTPITVWQTISGNTDNTDAEPEGATQTFLSGTPVSLSSGNIIAWAGTGGGVAAVVAGVSMEDAHNLASAGLGAPGPFTGIGFPGAGLSFGAVPNEGSALNIPRGAPFVTGQILYNRAIDDIIFVAQFDNSNGSVAADYTPVQANVGSQFGLTADSTAPVYWYVDKNKTTAGTNTVVEIVGLHPIDGSIVNARVLFKFLRSASQFL